MSPVIDQEYLLKEKAESLQWEMNPVVATILRLLENELSNDNYRKLDRQQVIDTVTTAFSSNKLLKKGSSLTAAERVIRKLNKCATRDDCILALGEYICDI